MNIIIYNSVMGDNFTLAVEPRRQNQPIASTLSGINQDIKEQNIAENAAKKNLGYVNLLITPINPDYLRIIPKQDAEVAKCIAYFRIGKKIKIAVIDEQNPQTINTLNQLKNNDYTIFVSLMSEESFQHGLQLYELSNIQAIKEEGNDVDDLNLDVYEKEIENLSLLQNKLKTVTMDEALNIIFVGAYKTGASDIHVDPDEKVVHLKFRIDGVLQNIFDMDTPTFHKITTQLKYNCKMRLNVTNLPQDGRTSFIVNKNKIDVRVSTLPTEFGETIVMRLLDKRKGVVDFDILGYEGQALDHLKQALEKSHGMILVTGPTGSGKTTTLYSIMQQLNKPENKIVTLEDPIEYHIANITQSQVDEKIGYTFSTGLRAIVRQDPDVVMVGEIRDLETAQIAAQAALTGHIVLSTLHTNNATDSIPRLMNMGLPTFVIAPSINAIVAQRLVRKLCEHCKNERPITEKEKKDIINLQNQFSHISISIPHTVFQPTIGGCDHCSHTGYKGQTAIIEVMLITDEIKELIFRGASQVELNNHLRSKGFMAMKEYGLLKVLKGVISFDEVYRVATN